MVESGDEEIFWKVDSGNLLTVTKNFNEASVFHINPCDDEEDTEDFNIGWRGETQQDIQDKESLLSTAKTSNKIMRYLELQTFFFGHHPGPLKFKSELSSKNSRLCLYSQISKGYFDSPEDDITPWIEKKEVAFISSAASKSFIAVVRYRNNEQADTDQEDAYLYQTKCMGSRKEHNEQDIWMLYRLIAAEPQTKKVSITERSKRRLSTKLTEYLKN